MHLPDSPRLYLLHDWVNCCLADRISQGALQLSPLSGDGGFRNYYRISGITPPLLGVDASPAIENNRAFYQVAELLRQYGIHTPQIHAVDLEQGFLLIEDMGTELYSILLGNKDKALNLYEDAEQCLLRMAAIPTQAVGLPLYNAVKLQQELNLFPVWLVEKLLQIKINDQERGVIEAVNTKLIASALEQPSIVVHRDFHCRNLLYVPGNNPGVIDFQDAVVGPITYDLVSLYRDCYVHWPSAEVGEWVKQYYQKLIDKNLLSNTVDSDIFAGWFDWMGLQRHIKVLGIFARLYLRDNKVGYLKDLPLVMHYVLSVASQYEAFSEFISWFESRLLPVAKTHTWYKEVAL